MKEQEKQLLEVVGEDIGAPMGARVGDLLRQLSANPQQAIANRGRFAIAFDISGLGIRDTPTYAVPRVRDFFREVERRCPHAAYFLVHDAAMGVVETFLLSLIPISDARQFRLDEYVEAAFEHSNRVTSFCERIGDNPDDAIEGLLLSLPVEAIVDQPALRVRVLRLLAPYIRAASVDFLSLNSNPEGRQALSDLLRRAEPLALLPRSNVPSQAAFARLLRELDRS